MIQEISDTRLQYYFKNAIKANAKINDLKSAYYCGSKIVHVMGEKPAVFLLSNGSDAKFFANTACHNAWFCPVCAAKMMAKYANEIACAIDALKKTANQTAFMITFTIPHTSGMSCEETTEILYNTWKHFVVHGNKRITVYKQSSKTVDGKRIRIQNKNEISGKLKDVFSEFCEEFNCKHRVRVGEFTWGEHGWHPHFHCLFWVDKHKLQKVIEWQEKINERWLKLAKHHTIKYWNQINPDKKTENQIRADIMYQRLNEVSKGAYISVDKDGKVIKQESSMYICGWGADRELTGNVKNKASKEGHLTPHQILEKAAAGDKLMEQLYLEYALATRKKRHPRINFSNSDIKSIIKTWQLTNEYRETLKKKVTSADQNQKWKVVCWFNSKQWSEIYYKNSQSPILHNLLYLATLTDAKWLIRDFLLSFDIDISNNNEHELTLLIEELFNQIYEPSVKIIDNMLVNINTGEVLSEIA